jgi:hypothetical protein
MALQIKRGKLSRPQKVVIYAPAGIGKSTLASQLPNPLFIDFEGGTHQLDVSRLEPQSITEFEKIVRELCRDRQGFDTVVIDTIDWLEETAVRQVVSDADNENVKTIEDFGFGKGWMALNNKMTAITQQFDRLIDAGLHVVCLAHAAVRKFEDPKQSCSYDRYELKMYKDRPGAKGSAALIKEWADALLFGSYEDRVKAPVLDGGRGKAIATSGRERALYCAHSAAWDAKNRHGLKDKEPWNLETLMKVLGNPTAPAKSAVPNPVVPGKSGTVVPAEPTGLAAGGAAKVTPVVPKTAQTEPGKPAPVDAAPVAESTSAATGAPSGEADSQGDVVVFVQPLPKSDDPIEGVEEAEDPDEELDRILGPHAEVVNCFLRDKAKVGPYQSYRSIDAAYRQKVMSNPVEFINRVRAYAKGGSQ